MFGPIQFLVDLVLVFYYIAESVVLCLIPSKFRVKDISGQIALVTGAGGGIGRLLAVGLAKQGCRIVCWDVAPQANEETVRVLRSIGAEAYAYQVDLTKKEDIYRVAAATKRDVGQINILVNNAGVVTGKNLLECTDEQILRTFDVNTLAHFWTVKSFLPDMIKQGKGHIVTVASLAGMNGANRLVDYCASKFAAVGFDESLRAELMVEGHSGIKTTVVCPYFVRTPLFAGIKSKVVPVLEAEQVAEEAIKSILTDEPICIVPRYLSLMMVLKSLMPIKVMNASFNAFGLGETMNAFEGPKTKYL